MESKTRAMAHKKNMMFYAGCLFIVLGVIKCLFGDASSGGVVIATGLTLVILINFDVELIKLPFLEAKLRKTLNEAEDILEKLRGISLPVSEIAITTASQTGFYQRRIPRKMLYEYVKSITTELEGMNVSSENIQDVKKYWYISTAAEMAGEIAPKIIYALEKRFKELDKEYKENVHQHTTLNDAELDEIHYLHGEVQSELHYFKEDLDILRNDYQNFPSYLKDAITKSKTLTKENKESLMESIKEELMDLEFLINNKDLRRPSIWFSRT
jgi:predicted DNA-binding protein (UPF0278 family)/energy-converting hydrogenase Eha subunit E